MKLKISKRKHDRSGNVEKDFVSDIRMIPCVACKKPTSTIASRKEYLTNIDINLFCYQCGTNRCVVTFKMPFMEWEEVDLRRNVTWGTFIN